MTAFLIGIPGGPEIWIICLVVLILFGGAAIPKFAKSLGRAKKEFEDGIKEGQKKDADSDNKTSDESKKPE